MDSSSFISAALLQRLRQLSKWYPPGDVVEVELPALAEKLACTERNVSKLMRSLADKELLNWTAGRGRGRRSKLELRKSFGEVLLGQFEQLAKSGRIDQAYHLAEQFDQQALFQDRLPLWLDKAQEQLREQNTLVYLIPYTFPEWRPYQAVSARSVMLISGLFDPLVRYDSIQQRIVPHLAHSIVWSESQLRLRIREHVMLHNGKLLTPELVKANIEFRRDTPHPYQLLFRHLDSVEVEGQWVVFNMRQPDPVFLHLLADIHSGMFDLSQPEKPVGTGPYQIDLHQPEHWSLVRNRHYFGFGGQIERIDFWASLNATGPGQAHVQEACVQDIDLLDNGEVVEQNGCSVLQFKEHPDRLVAEERAWLVHHFREFEQPDMGVANSLLQYHQDKGFHLFHTSMRLPAREVVFEYGRRGHRDELLPVLESLTELGLKWRTQMKSEPNNLAADVSYDCYVFSDDTAFQYYEWLLAGEVFTDCLPAGAQQSLVRFVDTLMQESDNSQDFLRKLYRAEDWLIQNYYYAPLWRDRIAYSRAENLHGTETDNMGIMSLANMWLE